MGFPLIRFEDAVINLDPFTRVHPYETKEFIINDILKHFQEVSFGEVSRAGAYAGCLLYCLGNLATTTLLWRTHISAEVVELWVMAHEACTHHENPETVHLIYEP